MIDDKQPITIFRTRRKTVLAILLGILLVTSGVLTFFVWNFSGATEVGNSQPAEQTRGESQTFTNLLTRFFAGEFTPKIQTSKLDGTIIPREIVERAVAVMIENLPASRPQMVGLNEASIVYEALAEGGITRFLALFSHSTLAKVGPVRSARPYYVAWAAEYDGAYVHAGGSPEALELLANSNALWNQDEDGVLLFRDTRYPKPHNLFLDLSTLVKTLTEKNWASVQTPRFNFNHSARNSAPPKSTPVSEFTLDFSTAEYRVHYRYDPAQKNYVRELAGSVHAIADGAPIRPRNVLIQFTDYIPTDDEGRLELRTSGEGEAWYFSEGKFWRGTWSKLGTAPTQFLDENGDLVQLMPGQTFIEVIDTPTRIIMNYK